MSNSTSLTGSSKQYIGVVDMLCEGPIYGLEKGKNDVYINDVPFENASIVGSLTDSGGARSLTLTPTSATSMSVTNGNIKQTDVGKYAHIEAKKAGVSSISQTNYDQYTVTTITPSETLSAEWHNYQLDKYYTKLRNTVTGRVYNAYSYWNATSNVITLYSLPIRRGFGPASNWELVLVQSSKIASYTSDTAFTLGDNLHNYSNLTDARFTISASVATNPDNPDPSATTSKVEGSTLQFRKGQLEQAPISQVHGVSGGVTKTGNTAAAQLKQYSNSTELNNYKSGSPYSGISTSGYPTGQSYSENSGPQLEFVSSSFGASTPEQVNEVNIRINYNSLILYNTENGDKEDAYAIYVFEVATKLNGTWSNYLRLFSQYGTFIVHRGRTTAPVSFDHTIGLDRFKPFDDFRIRITRLTRDAGLPVRANGSNGGETDIDKWNLQAVSSTGGANLSSTIHDSFIYPHTAIAAVSFSSKSYNQLPSRSYLLKGLMVEIPTAYTPREYSSTGVAEYDSWWDGNFKTELHYTDNPAWVFYDIATNARYGAGNWLESYNLDKFALYRIAKYCDELVDDGNGGTEPRFRANVYLAKATDVYKVLKDFASIFTGMLYWLDGKLSPIQDVPGEPVYTFSKANVIDGKFNYESTGRKTRSNQVVVTWNDPTRNYEPVNLIVEDREDIVAQRRIVSQKAVAFGATSEGQAIRYGRWKLWTAQNQKEIVSFQTGLQGAYIRPGDVINVQDRDRYGIDFSGKIADVTTDNRLLLDRAITNITDPDGNDITYEISTLVTNFAAYYTGLDPIHIDNSTGIKVSSNPGDGTVTTFNRGDRYTAVFWYPDPSPNAPAGEVNGFHAYYSSSTPPGFEPNEIETGANDIYDLSAENAENVISQAHYLVVETGGDLGSTGDPSGSGYSTFPLQLEWKPHSYVVTKDVTLNTSNGITAVSMASGETWYSTSEVPVEGTIFALVAKNSGNANFLGSAKEYRVLGISFEESKNVYGISAVEHYNSKYDAVDKDYALGVIPDNTYAEIEDPDAVVPAPGNIYVVSETDSSKPGEEFRIEWDVPQEEYADADNATQLRPYEFLNDYEIYHTVPDLDNPLFTANNSYRFQGVPDGIYTFRVRTRSRKGNTSDYVSVTYDVNDPFGTNVPRVVGGLPKGIVANSTAYDVHNSEITDEEDRYKLIWERDSSARGYSIGNSMFGGTSAISTYLSGVGLFGLAVSGPLVVASSGTSTDRPDGYTGDSEWHYLHYDGSTSLSYWNTRTLENLPFYHKINTGGFGWRGSSQGWTALSAPGGFTTAQVPIGSNRLIASTYGDFTNDLTIRDIVHFDGKAQTFEMYKIEQLREESGESVVSVTLREYENAGYSTDPLWEDSDIVTFERVGGATGVNGQYYYVKTTADDDRFQLYFDYDLQNPVRTSNLGSTYTTLTGFVTRAKVKAAKVIGVIDDNTAILDRSFNESISVNRLYKLTYRPDYNDDAVFGRVKWNGYDNVDDIHTFTVDTFITVDEGLNVGALQLTLIPAVSNIDYNGNDFSQETTFSGALTVNAIAAGFSNPQFRITKVEGAGTSLDFDMEAENLDISWTNASGGGPQATLEVFSQAEANAIPYENRDPIIITGEVRESQNTGLNTTATCQISKTPSGTDGIDGKTVEIRAEDNSIIYNEAGLEPILNGTDRILTFTATAQNYSAPQFKFTFEGDNIADSTAFTFAGDPGDGAAAGSTYTWETFKVADDTTNSPKVATAAITIPDSWDGNWADDKKTRTFRVLVEVREGSTGIVTSTDVTTVTGVHASENGYWFAMSNGSGNAIICDELGNVKYDTVNNPPDSNGFVQVADTGTTLEVGKGADILEYVTVNDATWSNYTDTERLGKYRVTYTESPDAAINLGVISYDNSTNIITYGAHKFSATGWVGDTAEIAYNLQIENLSELVTLRQAFTKSKAGFGGIRPELGNPYHQIPTDAEGNKRYVGSGTTLNCFMTGLNLPYYSAGATIPSSVDVFWRHKSTSDTGITVGTRTEPTDGSTAPVVFGNASAMTGAEATITFTIGVSIRREGNFVEEEIDITQNFALKEGAAYVNAFANPSTYIYDGDDSTPSPSTGHNISYYTSIGIAEQVRVEISGGNLSTPIVATSSSSGTDSEGNPLYTGYLANTGVTIPNTQNLSFRDSNGDINSYEYTISVYNANNTNNVLAEDKVFITGSFTQSDSVVMELTNDGDMVSWASEDSTTSESISLSTTANIYIAGTLDSPSNWTFTFSESSEDIAGNSSTSQITAAFDSTNTNQLNITGINRYFVSGEITITASHNAGTYDDHQAVYRIQRLFGINVVRIVASPDVVTKDPNTGAFVPTNRTVTFTFTRVAGAEQIALGDFSYKIGSAAYQTVNAGTNTSHSVTYQFPANTSTNTSITVGASPFDDYSYITDSETVPVILGGPTGPAGQDGIVANITAERASVSYSKNAQQTYDADDNSVQLTVDTSGITNAQYSWSGQVASTSVNSAQNSIPFSNGVSETVAKQAKTASVEVTGQNSKGQAITAIQKSITIGTSVGAVGSNGAPGLIGLQSTSGYIYSASALTSAQATSLYQQLGYTGYSFAQQSLQGTDTNWSLSAPEFQASTTDSSTQYYYIRFTAQEARNSNGDPSGDTSYDANSGQAVQGSFSTSSPQTTIGFSGLVTFSGTTITTGQQSFNYTAIDGGQITTGQIDAARINVQQINVTQTLNYQAPPTQTSQLQNDSNYQTNALTSATQVNITQTQNYVAPPTNTNQLQNGAGFQSGLAQLSQFSNDQQFQAGLTLLSQFSNDQQFQNAAFTAPGQINVLQTANYVAPPTNTNQLTNGAGFQTTAIEFSGTAISGGKIGLSTTGLIIGDQNVTVAAQNSIILDTTQGANTITIYDGTTPRVKLGKL